MTMDLHEARRLLGLPRQATPVDVEVAFRRLARRHHPDHGGDATDFARLVVARNTLRADDVAAGGHQPSDGASHRPSAAGAVRVVRTRWWQRALRALRDGLPPGWRRRRRDLA